MSVGFSMKVINVCSSLLEKIPLILASIFFVFTIAALLYSQSILPWSLWKHLCIDTVTMLVLPVLLFALSGQMFDIYEFCYNESLKPIYNVKKCPRDVRIYVWEDIRYYDHMTSIGKKHVSIAFDPSERDEEN